METLNIAIAVLLLLSAAAGAWLTRQNHRLLMRLGEARHLAAELMTERDQALAAHNRIWWEGYYKCDAEWKATPVFQKALVEVLGIAAETDVVRQSGELERDIKELTVG